MKRLAERLKNEKCGNDPDWTAEEDEACENEMEKKHHELGYAEEASVTEMIKRTLRMLIWTTSVPVP